MSGVLPLSEPECARALGLLAGFVDGGLAAEEAAWLDGHLDVCAECAAALAGFAEIDGELTGWGQRLGWQNPPPRDAREQLAARMATLSAGRRAVLWLPLAAAAIAAALFVATLAPRKPAPAVDREPPPFIEIPYVPPLDPHENAAIVRMNIRVSTLIAVGYRVTADPDATIAADVLVGEDGRAHAVRVLPDAGSNGTGD